MAITDTRNNHGRCPDYGLLVNFKYIFNYTNMLKYFKGPIELFLKLPLLQLYGLTSFLSLNAYISSCLLFLISGF